MKFNADFAVIHAYLCGDGYVVKNPLLQKHKYYRIGFRNMNMILLQDFQQRFSRLFNAVPTITKDGRCRIESKEIFLTLTKDFNFYSGKWSLPEISKSNLCLWLRAYFDCDGWVECQKAKSRSIRLDSINEIGLNQIKTALFFLGITSTIYKRNRNIWRLSICGYDNIKRFKKHVGFLHPDKKVRLEEAISSYRTFDWIIPEKREELLQFILTKGKIRDSRKEIRLFSIKKSNLIELKKALYKLHINSKIQGPWENNYRFIVSYAYNKI